MKRIISVILVLWCLILPVSALQVPNATDDFFVNDYADVLSAGDELVLQQRAENLYYACGAQVVVVTLESLEGEDIADIALRIARTWGIGDKDKDNGLLLLFSKSEPRVRIEVGNGLEGAIPDSKAGRILDTDMLPHYPDYATAITATQNTLINEVYIEYGLSPAEDYTPIDERFPDQGEGGGLFSTLFKIAAVIGVIILFIRHPRLLMYLLLFGGRGGRGGHGGRGGSSGGFSGGGGGFSGGGASR